MDISVNQRKEKSHYIFFHRTITSIVERDGAGEMGWCFVHHSSMPAIISFRRTVRGLPASSSAWRGWRSRDSARKAIC